MSDEARKKRDDISDAKRNQSAITGSFNFEKSGGANTQHRQQNEKSF